MSSTYVTEPHTSGKVVLHTTIGALDVELWPKESPKAVRNFVQLCLEGYYDGCIFHRLIKDFIVQTGDPTGTGEGGESIYGGEFAKEFHSRLRFTHRGLLAMAGGPDGNLSQFFITLDKTPQLERRHTIFGKLTGNAIYNILPVNDLQVDDNERPLFPPKIVRTEVLFNPFDDIVPRERRRSTPANVTTAETTAPTVKRVTNRNVLSFVDGDDDDDDNDDDDEGNALAKKPIKLVPVHEKPTPMMLEAQAKKKRRKRVESSSSSSSSESNKNKNNESSSDSSSENDDNDSSDARNANAAKEAAARQRTLEESRLKAEIRAARGHSVAETAKKAPASVRMDSEYDIASKRAKFSKPSNEKSRTKDVLAKLAGFSSKVRNAEATAVTVTDDETRCKLHSRVKCETCVHNVREGGDDDSVDDPKSLFSHSLVFQKEAKHADQMTRHDDEFEVTDFRNLADPLAASKPAMPIDRDEQARREAIRSGGHRALKQQQERSRGGGGRHRH